MVTILSHTLDDLVQDLFVLGVCVFVLYMEMLEFVCGSEALM